MSDLDQMYQQIILDASRERHGEGHLDDAGGESFQVNPTCGDQATMRVKLSSDGSRLEKGCVGRSRLFDFAGFLVYHARFS